MNINIVSSVPLSSAPPKPALAFDGVDDYVEVPDSPSLTFGDELTVEVYFRLDDTPPMSVPRNLV